MRRLFTSIALLTLTVASGVALAQPQQNKPETLERSLEGRDIGSGTALPPGKLGNSTSKPANRDAGNLVPTRNPPSTANGKGATKQVLPAERLGNTGPKPANRDAA
ncbi:MAG TPA: hypothetical protein VGD08_11740, partial [Stellaceae bacterium]